MVVSGGHLVKYAAPAASRSPVAQGYCPSTGPRMGGRRAHEIAGANLSLDVSERMFLATPNELGIPYLGADANTGGRRHRR